MRKWWENTPVQALSLASGIVTILGGVLGYLGLRFSDLKTRFVWLIPGILLIGLGVRLFFYVLKRLRDGPKLSVRTADNTQHIRLRIDDDVFYYAVLIQNQQNKYEVKASDLTASLSFKHYRGEEFSIPKAQFLRRLNSVTETFTNTVELGMGESAEIVILVSKGKFLTLRKWPLNEDVEEEFGPGEWTCNVVVKGENASAKAKFKIQIKKGGPAKITLPGES